jgi:hypothetical protein
MKRVLLAFALLVLAVAGLFIGPATADEKKPGKKKEASLWMTRKLEFAQKILRGLTEADFELIEKEAGRMQVVGYLEEWDRGDTPEYKRQLRYFTDANKELIRQAKNKNINGATLAYTQLTLSCVQCHNLIRDLKKK